MSKSNGGPTEIKISSEDVHSLYHELSGGVGVIRTAFNRIVREGSLDSTSLKMYEGGLKKLVDAIEKIDVVMEKG